LHKRIDPTIDLLCKPPKNPKLRIRSPQHMLNKNETKVPKGAPIWTLNKEALKIIKWDKKTIPIYDPDTSDQDDDNNSNDDNDSDNDDDNNDNDEAETSSRKRKRKGRRKEKERKNKKSKKNKKNN
jgi:hypothetical protein